MLKTSPFLIVICLLCCIQVFSQTKTCESSPNDDLLLDINSITKCSIDKSSDQTEASKKNKKISVVVSSRKRIVRKRNTAKGIYTSNSRHRLDNLKRDKIIADLNLENKNENKIIPLDFVEQVPLFKSCESSPITEQDKCFKAALTNHIKKNFKYPNEAYNNGIQGKVLVYFTIGSDGKVGRININAPYKGELLADEAERILRKLPTLKPGKHNGSNVIVKYAFPINFKIPGVKPTNIKKEVEVVKKIEEKEILKFDQIEKLPLFKTCNKSKNTSLDCFNQELIAHIQQNFAYPQKAVDKYITGTVNIKFIIDKKGKVIHIETKGPENGKILETAAKVLIQKLPRFTPATKNGEPVNVTYSFPVNFKLD